MLLATVRTPTFETWLMSPQGLPQQADLLHWAQNMSPGVATALVIGGGAFLVFGYYLFRWFMVMNALIVGGFIGFMIGERAGSPLVGGLVGSVLSAAVAWPFMKYAVALMGGIFGALMGVSLWRTTGLEAHLSWAGALSGLVGFGLLSFIVFRLSVMTFMSLQGSVMLIFGVLGLIYKYQSVAPQVDVNMVSKPFLLPLAIFVPAVLGILYQHSMYPPPNESK
jgi:hypothetical protein